MTVLSLVAGLLVALGLGPEPVFGQSEASLVGGQARSVFMSPRESALATGEAESAPGDGGAALLSPTFPQAGASSPSPVIAALLSGLLPGAGQHAQGQRRKWAYLALEAVGWIVWADTRSAALDLRSRYRDFAWSQARIRTGTRLDGDFDYYETMSKWQRSGLFDVEPASPTVQPEPDETTYNGTIWSRAARLYIPGDMSVLETDTRYQRALDYYRERAYGTEFLWDWTGTGTAQDEFGTLIRRSDDRFRRATNILGLVMANHLVSMVDAFVSARGAGTTVRSGLVPAPLPGGLLWTARVDVWTPW